MSGVINGRQWLRARLRVLEEALERDDLDPAERARLGDEAARVHEELAGARRAWLFGTVGGGGVADAYRAWRNRRA